MPPNIQSSTRRFGNCPCGASQPLVWTLVEDYAMNLWKITVACDHCMRYLQGAISRMALVSTQNPEMVWLDMSRKMLMDYEASFGPSVSNHTNGLAADVNMTAKAFADMTQTGAEVAEQIKKFTAAAKPKVQKKKRSEAGENLRRKSAG